MAVSSTSLNNPRHLAVNMLRLLACIERSPLSCNVNSVQRLREQIDSLHQMKPTVAFPDGLDLDSVDRRVEAIMELGRSARLVPHQRVEVDSASSELPSLSVDEALSSFTPVAASAILDTDENDMRLALLTPKGAPSRKRMVKFKPEKPPLSGGSVSMQNLRSESITKMNNQLKNVMRDIQNTATKVCALCHAEARG